MVKSLSRIAKEHSVTALSRRKTDIWHLQRAIGGEAIGSPVMLRTQIARARDFLATEEWRKVNP
jgi:hypothetical protein